MELIKDILRRSKEEKKFIGIWLYNDDDGFWSGYVKDFDEAFVFLRHYTKYGKPDGIIVEQIENIESIDFDDDYSNAMEYLIANSEKIDIEPEIELHIKDHENWQYEILEQQLSNNERIVGIQVNRDNFYSGFVTWIDEDNVILNMVGKEGQDQGKTIFKLEDINAIRINDIENRKKLLLYKWKKASGR